MTGSAGEDLALLTAPPTLRAAEGVSSQELRLFGGPYVVDGNCPIPVPEGSKRLLVFIALRQGRVDRRQAAGTLWPNGDDERAAGNLRSALWRMKGAGINVVGADKYALWLDPQARFDVRDLDRWAGRIIEETAAGADLRLPRGSLDAMDLLPGWYDDWVIYERERLRQRLLHALESLSRVLAKSRLFAQAIEVALEGVRIDPLRESALRVLMEAHLAEGNLCEARRIYRDYSDLVRRELGISPDPELLALVGGCGQTVPPHASPTSQLRLRSGSPDNARTRDPGEGPCVSAAPFPR